MSESSGATAKTDLILKVMSVLFLLSAVLNHHILFALLKYNYFFWLQYVGAVFVLAYFLSAVWSFYTAFWGKKYKFLSIYVFVLLAGAGMTSSVFPIPFSFVSGLLLRALLIWAFDLVVLLFVVFLHIVSHRVKRAGEKAVAHS